MQLNKSKRKLREQSTNNLFDDDFASGFEDSGFDKFKPALKVLMAIVILMSITWSVSAYFGRTDTKNDTNKNYTSGTVQQAEDSSSEAQDTEAAKVNLDSPAQGSDSAPSSNNTQQRSSSSPTTTKSYDPSKCESLNNEAMRLRQVAEQKKITYDNAFSARRSYGDIYSEVRNKYGNDSSMYPLVTAETDRIVKAENERLNSLQADWQDALNKGNAAYGKYQECRASL